MPEPKNQASGRRKLLRNIVAVGAAGVAGLVGAVLLDEKTGVIPQVQATSYLALCTCNTGTGGTRLKSSTDCGTFCVVNNGNGPGLIGGAGKGCGVIGTSGSGAGVYGTSTVDIGVLGGAAGPCAIPLVAKGVVGQTASLQEWQNYCGSVLSRVDKVGSFNVDTNHTNNGSQLNNHSSTGIGLYFGDPCSGEGISSNRSSTPVKDLEFWTNHTARMTVANCGNVGIGTTTPEAPLTVLSSTSITAALIGSSQGNLIFAKSGTNGFSMYSNAANYLGFYSNDSGIQPLTMNGSGVAVGNAYKSTAPPTNGAIIQGDVGIGTSAPTQTLSVQGTAGKSCGGSTWATFSDRRWKCQDSIEPYTEGLAWVRSLPQPMRFRYAPGNGIGADSAKEHVNFVAQCLLDGTHQNLVSEIQAKVKRTDKAPTTTYAVNVSDMQFAMLNAIKELAEENATLKEQLAEQDKTLREELNEKLTEQTKAMREEIRMLQGAVKRLAAS